MIPEYPMIRYQYLSSCELLWKTAKQKGSQNSELKIVSKFDIDRAIYKIEQLYTIQRSCNRNNLTEMKFIINKNGWHSSCFIITISIVKDRQIGIVSLSAISNLFSQYSVTFLTFQLYLLFSFSFSIFICFSFQFSVIGFGLTLCLALVQLLL